MLKKAEREGAINDLIDLAERGNAGGVIEAAKQNPSLLDGRPQYRDYSALQLLVATGDDKAASALLSLKPDLSITARDGRLASEIAAEKGHHELAAMLRPLEQKRLLEIDYIEDQKPPRSFIGNYVRAVMFAPLIGKRAPWDKKPVDENTGRRVAEGLRNEGKHLAEQGFDGNVRILAHSPPS